jgi:hypothetical protein
LSQDTVDAEVIEHRFVGPNFVVVRLNDGTECKLIVEVRVCKAKDQRNPDGTPQYLMSWTVMPSWKTPVGTKIKVPRPPVPAQGTKPPDQRITQ